MAPAVDSVSLRCAAGDKIALVGETGSGKSVLLLAFLRMLPSSAQVSGRALLDGRDMLSLTERELRMIRGRRVSYIPQGCGNGMNPLLKTGFQIAEPLTIHHGMKRRTARGYAAAQLERLGFADAESVARLYPHALSGGMRQRCLIAMGVIASSEFVFADEPTKGLDASCVNMVTESFEMFGERSLICVTHDLGFARSIAREIVVMYAGQVVETAPREMFFAEPLHPYSRALIAALPENGLKADKGFAPPKAGIQQTGCLYMQRCPQASVGCDENQPLTEIGNRKVRCWRHAS
jgi:peptide/nickel transport system ATP-binding protein